MTEPIQQSSAQVPTQQPVQSVVAAPAPKRRHAWHLVFALFVGLPAIFFWLSFSVLSLGIFSAIGSDDSCNVARISLHGILLTTGDGFTQLLDLGAFTSADWLVDEITYANEDESIQAIVIDVNSPGGTPVAADEVMQALAGSSKATVAVVRDLGASAAYWAIAGADHIVASPISDVGSIGVTMSYTEFAGANEEEGSRWVGISSGLFKDAGNPDRRLTEVEQEYFQTQVDTVHDYMVSRIAETRESLSHEEVLALADGRAYLGSEALPLKLIDELGGMDDALAYLGEKVVFIEGEPILCEPAGTGFGEFF